MLASSVPLHAYEAEFSSLNFTEMFDLWKIAKISYISYNMEYGEHEDEVKEKLSALNVENIRYESKDISTEYSMYKDKKGDTLYLIFHGTQGFGDAMYDAKVGLSSILTKILDYTYVVPLITGPSKDERITRGADAWTNGLCEISWWQGSQEENASLLGCGLDTKGYKKIYIAGHSLGGGLAQQAYISAKADPRIRVVTFNTMAIPPYIYQNMEVLHNTDHVTHVINAKEPLNFVQRPVLTNLDGPTYYLNENKNFTGHGLASTINHIEHYLLKYHREAFMGEQARNYGRMVRDACYALKVTTLNEQNQILRTIKDGKSGVRAAKKLHDSAEVVKGRHIAMRDAIGEYRAFVKEHVALSERGFADVALLQQITSVETMCEKPIRERKEISERLAEHHYYNCEDILNAAFKHIDKVSAEFLKEEPNK